MPVILIGTLDTKGGEFQFVRDLLTQAGLSVQVIDASVLGTPYFQPDISREQVYAAAGTSLAVLVPPIGLLAAWKYYHEGRMDVGAALWIALAFAAGAYLGAAAAPSVPVPVLRLAFGLMLIFVAVRFMFASDASAASAAAGLASVAAAWAAYWGLRRLGRKHLTKPDLGEAIRKVKEKGTGDVDYYI